MPTQSKIGWRPYVNPSITASSLWTSIYSVYNADAIGSTSLNTSLFSAYNGESNANDSFGSNNGTAVGGLTYTTGKIGNAFTFNGSNSYVSLPNSSGQFNFTGDFSVSCWFKTNTVSGNQMIFSNLAYNSNNRKGFYIALDQNTIYCYLANQPYLQGFGTSAAVSINTWYHLTVTRESGVVKIYLNGTLLATNTNVIPLSYVTTLTSIGAYTNGFIAPLWFFNGSIDALNVWQKSLTQSEITELYNSGNGAQYITDSFYKPTTNDALLVNNGTAVGGLTYGLGKVGTAFVFNGSNSYVRFPDNSFNSLNGSFSVSAWFKTPSSIQAVSNYIFNNRSGNTWFNNPNGFTVQHYGNSIYFVIYNNTNSYTSLNVSYTFSPNTWYHITATKLVNGNMKLYLNGALIGTLVTTVNPTYLATVSKPCIGVDLFGTKYDDYFAQNGFMVDALNIWSKELSASEITELYNSGNGKQYVSSLDSDAQAFIASAAITVTTQQTAINTLVTDLKAANIWTKMIAFYPFVGGNATAHSYNLINVANYQLMFMGGGTHTSLGYVGNGLNGYAKTSIIPNNVFTQNNIHVSYYSQTDGARAADDIGVYQAGKAPIQVYMRYGSTTSLAYLNASTGSSTVSTGRRYLVASRQSSSAVSVTNNGTTSSISSNSAAALATNEIYIHSLNFNGSASGYSNRTSSTITFGQTLTNAEAQTLSAIVNTFNTTLGRNVY